MTNPDFRQQFFDEYQLVVLPVPLVLCFIVLFGYCPVIAIALPNVVGVLPRVLILQKYFTDC